MLCKILISCVFACALGGCAAMQAGENTLEMTDGISHLREVQVLRNIAAAVNDHDAVPSQIILATGQANASAGLTSTLKLPHFDFSAATKELDIAPTDTWTAQWQFTSVTNADDLRRLRNLYTLVASTDDQYDNLECYFRRHPHLRLPVSTGDHTGDKIQCSASIEQTQQIIQSSSPKKPERTTEDQFHCTTIRQGEAETQTDCKRHVVTTSSSNPSESKPVGSGPGNVVLWRQAEAAMKTGDSIGCKMYQEYYSPDGKGFPFRRWLFWRRSGEAWGPSQPSEPPKSLGRYEGVELGVTSQACFDDFVILVQGQTPNTEAESAAGAKVMLQ